ncbi:zinc finger, CCHC-type containing protein [Tanacetum coccineum]|uniref:Zinc finger, CCHC-type containing protein n=1 Tax=Tanacetum coccineum TaxID=301880 RepID=A0ABQ5DV34_9ASTR
MAAAAMSMVYVLTTPIPEDGGDDPTVEQVRKRNKWDNDDYVCRGLILKAKDASSKKFFVSNFTNYKMSDSRPVLEQYNELLGRLRRFTQHKMNMDESIQVSCIIDKLLPPWKDFKHTLKHLKEELTLVKLDSHLRIEESLGDGLILVLTWILKNVKLETDDLGADLYLLHNKDEAIDKLKVFKTEFELQQVSLIKIFRTDKGGEYMAPYTPQQNGISKRKRRVMKEMVNSMLSYSGLIVRLLDPKLKTLGERGIECIFVGYAEHSKAFRFYVIELNDSVAINSIIESKDVIFDENRFSSVPRPSLGIPKGTEDIGGLVVPKVVTDEVGQQPKSELRKSKRNRTLKDFGPEFQLYLIKGTRDEVSDQHSYCFNVEDDRKTFDEMNSIMDNNTWVLADLPLGCKPLGCKWIFKRKLKMDVKTAFLNGDLDEEVYMNQPQGFIMPGNENKVCKLIKSLYGLKQAPKQWHQKFDEVVLSNGYLLIQADKCIYNKFDESGKRVIICLYVDEMLIFGTDQVQVDLTKEFLSSRFSMKDMGEADVILVLGGYIDSSWISNTEDNSSTSGWVFLLDGGAISWASKKQINITGSIIESEFMALAAVGKEAECAATLAKAYNQMYNGESRYLGVRHSMIPELITNGVISIEFVRSQQNLADNLTKGLARDLVIKSAKGMGLKSS